MSELPVERIYLSVLPAALGCLVFLGLALVSLVREGRNNRTNRLFAAICFLGALINCDIVIVGVIPDRDLALTIDRIVYLFFLFSIPLYIHFTHAFFDIRRRGLQAAAYTAAFLLLPFTGTDLFISGHRSYAFGYIASPGPLYSLFLVLAGLGVFYCLFIMVSRLIRAEDNQQRNRITYIVIGFGAGSLLIFLNSLPVLGIPLYPLGNLSFIPAVILAFGVLKYDLLDLNVAVGRGFFYLFFAGSLAVLYFVILSLVNIHVLSVHRMNPLLLSFAMAVLVVVIYEPLKRLITVLMERYYFRGRYNYRGTLKEISGSLTSLQTLDAVGNYLVHSVYDALDLTSLSLAVFKDDNATAHFCKARVNPPCDPYREGDIRVMRACLARYGTVLSRATIETKTPADPLRTVLEDLLCRRDTVLVFPLTINDSVQGMLMLGEKKSGDLFTPEDMELLATIANQAAVAAANALNYERLETMNRDLEERVTARTADLTRLIEEKERTQERLIRSESLAAIGQLVAGTAHELNNPLAGALSLVESSLETLSDTECRHEEHSEIVEDLSFAAKEMRRAGDIIRSLLGLSRQTNSTTEPVCLKSVVDDTLRVLHARYKDRDIAIVHDGADDLPVMEGNFAHLGQAFINIINNAIQSLSPERGGHILLASRFCSATQRLVVACSDNGCGIPRENLAHIFKPFFTTKPAGDGTGLGLYITHEIIRRHGGDIFIESEEGKGTTIRIEFSTGGSES